MLFLGHSDTKLNYYNKNNKMSKRYFLYSLSMTWLCNGNLYIYSVLSHHMTLLNTIQAYDQVREHLGKAVHHHFDCWMEVEKIEVSIYSELDHGYFFDNVKNKSADDREVTVTKYGRYSVTVNMHVKPKNLVYRMEYKDQLNEWVQRAFGVNSRVVWTRVEGNARMMVVSINLEIINIDLFKHEDSTSHYHDFNPVTFQDGSVVAAEPMFYELGALDRKGW